MSKFPWGKKSHSITISAMIASLLLSYQKGQEAPLLSLYYPYYPYLIVLRVFNIARLHVAETDVQYSEAGTQIHALALDLHNKVRQVHWLVPSTLHITQKHAYLENKKQKSIFKPSQSSYIVYIVIVFRRISKQHIFRFQNIYNVGGNITHLTENIPCLPFWNWIALFVYRKTYS